MDAAAFESVEDLWPSRKENAFAGVDAECNGRNRWDLLSGEFHHRRRQCDRQIIDAIKAEVLQNTHRGHASGTGYTGNDYDAWNRMVIAGSHCGRSIREIVPFPNRTLSGPAIRRTLG